MKTPLNCPRGHSWQIEPLADGATQVCPLCGAAALVPADQTTTMRPDPFRTLPPAPADPQGAATVAHSDAAITMIAAAGRPSVPGYELLAELGRGGMGVVYQARHGRLQRIVALKMILTGGHADAAQRERFQAEAQAIARLQHPNIVQVHEVGEHDGLPFFSLEFCAGGSLAQKLAGTPLPPKHAAAIVETLARAMHVAHQKGILHRDLKPANVLFAEDGTLKITDFGLAKNLDEAGQTASGAIMGTPSYMAPEQAGGKTKEMGPACDVYALGAVLYECLTGRPPFKAATPLDTVLQVIGEEPVPPRQLNAQVPRDLETICLTCLHKQPPRRFTTAQALAEDLRRFGAGEPITARPVGPVERAVKWVRRNPAVATVAVTLLVSVIALTAGLFWYQDEQNRLATEENRRATEAALHHAEAERKKALAEAAVRQALDQTERSRAELHALLKKPGGVFHLLNDPGRWQAQDQTARASLDRALAVLANADEGVGAEGTERAKRLNALLDQDQADRLLAVRLEQIRTDRAHWVVSTFDADRAAEEYPKAFADAGFPMLSDEPHALAERMRASLVREQLVAALDDWAWVAFRLHHDAVVEGLLHIGRLAAPDPAWGNRLRQTALWRDPQALHKLVQEAPAAGLSAPLLQLIGMLLQRVGDPLHESWLWRAQAQYPGDFWLNYDLADVLQKANPVEATGFYRVALAIRPGSSAVHTDFGNTLRMQNKLAEAIAAYDKAIALDAKNAAAYLNLGVALHAQKKLPAAIAAYHKAIGLDSQYALAYNNLGGALAEQRRLPEAITAFQTAIKLDPQNASFFFNLGMALQDQQRLPEAITAYRQAIERNPNDARPYNRLGNVLVVQKKRPEAIAAFHQAIERDLKSVPSYGALGDALFSMGRFAEAAQTFQKGHDLIAANHPLRSVFLNRIKQSQQMHALAQRVHLVLEGKEPAPLGELLQMAHLCRQFQQRHAAAVRLYQDAFKAKPDLAENLAAEHRYNAAGAAALAGTGQGKEAAKLPAAEKAKLRQQARAWLRADLDGYAHLLKDGKAAVILQAELRLANWQADADLAGVRDPEEMASLPTEERTAWNELWTNVAALHKEVRSRFTEARVEGALTTEQKSKHHEWNLVAGRTYVIDLESTAFDTFLKLEDPSGKLLAENDDILPGVNLNSRLIVTAPADGVYLLVATSFEQAGAGAYTLRVREFKDGK